MQSTMTNIDQLCINTIRTLSMDGVQRANSGHPGTPMALAPLAHRIFTHHLRHDSHVPDWPDRDRFVLSCGHASMLLYSVLHLAGYDVSLDQLKAFRQLHSPTAGHPERGELPGVEFTTGPLGQGISSAVGMALAERMLASRFNTTQHTVVDHTTWVLASDGDLMEGVQAEAASLAGHLKLGKLIVFWDDNRITIDGTTDLSFSEDVAARYASYGWHVTHIADVDDLDAIDQAVAAARAESRPSLVVTRTHIGIGSPLQDTSKAHGAPLGAENIAITKRAYGWPEDASFLVPDEVREVYQEAAQRGSAARSAWLQTCDAWKASEPELAAEYDRRLLGTLPAGWDAELSAYSPDSGTSIATRKASNIAINLAAPELPEVVGGSADLAESNLTDIAGGGSVTADSYAGRNIHYGIREHAMGSITNGMVAHGGLRPFAGTFLVFSDYMRPAIRLSALMQLPSIWVFTHDSVWLGEDGPTHQPVEHLMSLRLIPGLNVIRPADPVETAQAWKMALETTSMPTSLALTRQNVPLLSDADPDVLPAQVGRGAYVLRDCDNRADAILIGTGSEVHLCLAAAQQLEADGINVRVVSMPSWELFAAQDADYRASVLPGEVTARVSVEAGATTGWERWIGDSGVAIGIDRFGMSAPGAAVAAELGICVDNIVATTRKLVTANAQEELHHA